MSASIEGVAGLLQNLASVSLGGSRRSGPPKTGEEALKIVAQEFESLFIAAMLKQMRSATLESKLLGGDRATKMYREMHDEAMAQEMSVSGGIGLARVIYDQLRSSV